MKTDCTRHFPRPSLHGRLLVLALAAAACAAAQAQVVAPTAVAQRKPVAVVDLRSAISQTAAVVEGTVSDIRNDYSESDGPWTRVALTDVKTHLGTAPDVVEIRHFGGRLPNGKQVVAAELPVFVQGKRYIVFLRNTSWNVSPVVGDLALRVEKLGDAEVLVNSDGIAVTGVGALGPQFGEALFQGPRLDGSPSQSLGKRLNTMAIAPLDRAGFVQALHNEIAGKGLAVAGSFNAQPGGEFKWRAISTAAGADRSRASDPVTPALRGSGVEVDTTRPTTR